MIWSNEKENLEKLIFQDKLSYEEIGRQYNCTGANIKKVAKKLGIVLEQRREINPKEHFNKKTSIIEEKHHANVKLDILEIKKPNFNFLNFKNSKQVGEMGERIAIGELSKYGLDILLPMSDNLPYDFVVVYNNKFYKCQVKTSTRFTSEDSIIFSIVSNNWNKGTIHQYKENEIDVFICCDLEHLFLFGVNEINKQKTINIKYGSPKNKQFKTITFASKCILSKKRIEEIFN